jgi:lysophospholipase L1-like esterase
MSFHFLVSNYLGNKMFLRTMFIVLIAYSFCCAQKDGTSLNGRKWVGTWSTAPQLVETNNNPPSPGLSNNTLRQILRVSIGGDSLRIRFSNEFSTSAVTLNSVHVAVSKGDGSIDPNTDIVIYFNGKQDVTMAAGGAVTSDPFRFTLQPRTDIAITIYFGNTSATVTGHPGSRTTSYLLTGNAVDKTDFTGAVTTDHWYVINTIDVLASKSTSAVVILGNSITDGRGSGTNKQNRWPDELARRLQEKSDTLNVAVLNQGIGGNCVLAGGLGPTAINRFKRDVINQNGVKWLIILEGINDIGGAWGTQGSVKVAQDLIAAYGKMIDSAHVKGILVYGATLLPFGGSSYDSPDHQTAAKTVNDWIRNSGRFDAVIDFAKDLCDPVNTLKMLSTVDSGDHLHPSETGHRMMAEAVDLNLFEKISTDVNEKTESLPNSFSLFQNYPNPFNPTTKIKFALPQRSFTKLIIYDTLGKEVQTLLNKELGAGYYEFDFDGSNLPSGVYLYSVQSVDFIETKKMTLVK